MIAPLEQADLVDRAASLVEAAKRAGAAAAVSHRSVSLEVDMRLGKPTVAVEGMTVAGR